MALGALYARGRFPGARYCGASALWCAGVTHHRFFCGLSVSHHSDPVRIAGRLLRGWTDIIISRALDILWAVPVYLFAISLSVVTVGHDLSLGPFHVQPDSLLLPIAIIALIYVPYAARPIRARTKSLSNAGFVLAARGLGASSLRIVFREILPLLVETVLVLCPLVMALCLLAESALSFLSLGVQAPAASWGSLIHDGEGLIYSRPVVAIAPGAAIILTVLSLNALGDAAQAELRRRGGR